MRNKFNIITIISLLYYLFMGFFSVESIIAQGTIEKLSRKRYVDPKGNFKIVPPEGWRVRKYSQIPKSKVAFYGPSSDVNLNILINSVNFSTIEELISYYKNIEKRLGLNTNIKRIIFIGRPAIERTFQLRGKKYYCIDLMKGKFDHKLVYSAPVNKYNKYHSVVMKSMDTYEDILQDVSDEEVNEQMVTKEKQNVTDSTILKIDVQDSLKAGYPVFIGFWKNPHFLYKGTKYPLKNKNIEKYSQIISVYPEALNEFNSYKNLHNSAISCNTAGTIFIITSYVYSLINREKYKEEPITLPRLSKASDTGRSIDWTDEWFYPEKKEDWTSLILLGTGAVFYIAGYVSEKHARSHLTKSSEIYNRNLKQNRFSFFSQPSDHLIIACGKSNLFIGFTFSL